MTRTIFGAFALSLGFVGAASAAELRMSWWGGDGRHVATQEALKYCGGKLGHSVKPEFAGFEGYLERLSTQLAGRIQEMLELHFPVAQDIGIGGAPGRIFGQEMGEDALPVFAGKIAEMKRYPQLPADRDRIAPVFVGAAVAAAVVGPVLHEQSRDRIACLHQPQRSDRRINPARYADDDPRRAHGNCCNIDSGERRPAR